MASILPVLTYPDERLRTIARPVVDVDENVKQLVRSMFKTMYANGGIGLAATQVDVHQRIIVMDVGRPFAFINPQVIDVGVGMYKFREGCLSVRVLEVTQRPDTVVMTALNLDGESVQYTFYDLEAACVLHEMEHLDGKLYFDRLSPLKRQRVLKKLSKK